eukprot:1613944-Rhodomonas_salina.1
MASVRGSPAKTGSPSKKLPLAVTRRCSGFVRHPWLLSSAPASSFFAGSGATSAPCCWSSTLRADEALFS